MSRVVQVGGRTHLGISSRRLTRMLRQTSCLCLRTSQMNSREASNDGVWLQASCAPINKENTRVPAALCRTAKSPGEGIPEGCEALSSVERAGVGMLHLTWFPQPVGSSPHLLTFKVYHVGIQQ